VLVGMPNEWRLMDSAPRDGSPILIALGSDCTSSAVYTGGPHPWKFIDMKGPGRPILNGMRDGEYGPTGWMPLPEWKRPEHVTVRQIRDAMMATQDDPALVADASLSGRVGLRPGAITWVKGSESLDAVAAQMASAFTQRDNGTAVITDRFPDTATPQVDARLISAAPALLAACKAILCPKDEDEFSAVVEAAIAKAEGR